jgi:hypothetical protein
MVSSVTTLSTTVVSTTVVSITVSFTCANTLPVSHLIMKKIPNTTTRNAIKPSVKPALTGLLSPSFRSSDARTITSPKNGLKNKETKKAVLPPFSFRDPIFDINAANTVEIIIPIKS